MLSGTMKNLNGGGHVALANGVAYGEPYESAVAELTVQGQDIEASKVVLKAHGMQIAGNGGYDWQRSIFMVMLKGTICCCRSLRRSRGRTTDLDGVSDAGCGCEWNDEEPGLKANLKLAEGDV